MGFSCRLFLRCSAHSFGCVGMNVVRFVRGEVIRIVIEHTMHARLVARLQLDASSRHKRVRGIVDRVHKTPITIDLVGRWRNNNFFDRSDDGGDYAFFPIRRRAIPNASVFIDATDFVKMVLSQDGS